MTTRTVELPNNDPFTILSKMRKRLFWAGIVMVVLGAAAIMTPYFSSLVVEVLIGWLLTMSGVLALIATFSLRGAGPFAWSLVSASITLVAGLLLLIYPLQGLVALTVLVAVVLVITGIAQGVLAVWVRPISGWVWGGASAIVSIVLGGYIFVALPDASAVILGLMVGIDFVSTGVALVLISRGRRAV
jgi:uncharacterized membrane protein HdeD (DUF308 family)